MGFASYLEDINSRITTIERIANNHSTSNYKRVNEGEELRRQNQSLQIVVVKLRKEIADLQGVMQQVNKEYAMKDSQLNSELAKTDVLKKQVSHETSLRKDQQLAGRNWSELVLDFKHLFQGMSEITKSNAWHKDKARVKQLESLIESGLRKN